MKKKLTFLMFGLLLAVGWTSSATAQALPKRMVDTNVSNVGKMSFMKEEIGRPAGINEKSNVMNQGPQFRAPLRSTDFANVTPSATHPKSWYEQELPNPYVTWNGGSQLITEPFTTVDGMMALIERVYTDQNIPGVKYSDLYRLQDIPYQTIEFGWNILGSNYYDDIQIEAHPYVAIYAIEFYNADGTRIGGWDAYNNGSSFPSTWTSTGGVGNYYGVPYLQAYNNYMGILTIPSSYVRSLGANTTGYVDIKVSAFNYYSSSSVSNAPLAVGSPRYPGLWTSYYPEYSEDYVYTHHHYLPGTLTPPDDAGYTILLVKLQDELNNVPEYTETDTTITLREYFTNYVKEIDLLTDGMRVNGNTDDAGTVFAYTGDLNKFYFIGKGKMAYGKSLYKYPFDRAPFYSMYEEFSPFVAGGQEDHSDFYEKMKQGVTYPVVHDCEGVIYLDHYFSMSGSEGTTENRVNSLVFYVPDNRGDESQWQTYDTDHQPTVGMYMIDLYADIEPSTTPDYYTVTVNWFDNLDVITNSDGIPQTYYLYQIMYNEQTGQNDTICVTPNGTNQTTWTHDYPVGDPKYYDIYYYVIGTPTAATNPDTFFAKSNTDDVTVPGKYDFLGLQWWRYESDYVTDDGTNQEVNYYRNFLAPHAMAAQGDIGITAGNVGTTGRTLTLFRKYEENGNLVEKPIMYLDLIMDGTKAMYRIRYINRSENQQVEPGYDPNTGELLNTNN
ncbi:MAG: hypothetical protein IJK93_09545 [Muribaculaceae bacterium]|nr:hypothetical protein [Muribaculaceae bacterium]